VSGRNTPRAPATTATRKTAAIPSVARSECFVAVPRRIDYPASMSDHPAWNLLLNRPLVAALAALFSSQLFKTLKPIAKGKPPRLGAIADYGGWPSSHTAFIVACATAVGIAEGFGSSLFALAFTVGCILVYDILKMRKVVSLDDHEVDRLLERSSLARAEKPPQFKAHSPKEILGGLLWGCAWALIVCALYSAWGS